MITRKEVLQTCDGLNTPAGEVRSHDFAHASIRSLTRQLLQEQKEKHAALQSFAEKDARIAELESALAVDGVAEDALSVEKAAHEVTKKALEMAAKCSSLPVTERQKQAVDALVAGWIQAAFFAIESARSAKGETK